MVKKKLKITMEYETKEEFKERILKDNYHADGGGGKRLSVLTEIAWQLQRIANLKEKNG